MIIGIVALMLLSAAHAADQILTCDLLLSTPHAREVQARAARIYAEDDADPKSIAGYVGVSAFELLVLLNEGVLATAAYSPRYRAVANQHDVERFRDRPYSAELQIDADPRPRQVRRARDDAWVRSAIDQFEVRHPELDLHDAGVFKYMSWRRAGMSGDNPAGLRVRELAARLASEIDALPRGAGVTLALGHASLLKVAWGRSRAPYIPRVEIGDVLEITPHADAAADFLFKLGRRWR